MSQIRTQIIGPTNCCYYLWPDAKLNATLTTNIDPNQCNHLTSTVISLLTAPNTQPKSYWYCLNGLALNPDKTDCILFGTRQRANSYLDITTFNVADTTATLKEKITRSSADADNRLDAFSGQSRSTNMVPFHMLHIVSYCAIVTLSWPFLRYSSSKNFMTLKGESKVTQGHWEWYHSIDCVWFPISVL